MDCGGTVFGVFGRGNVIQCMQHGIINGAGIEEEFATDSLFVEDVTGSHGVRFIKVDILDAFAVGRLGHM